MVNEERREVGEEDYRKRPLAVRDQNDADADYYDVYDVYDS